MLTIIAKYVIVLTIYSAPVNVADTAGAITFAPAQTIEFRNTTDKNTLASCVRVQKALLASNIMASCGEVAPL